MTFVAGLGVGVIPYLPGDAVKIIFTALIGPKAAPRNLPVRRVKSVWL